MAPPYSRSCPRTLRLRGYLIWGSNKSTLHMISNVVPDHNFIRKLVDDEIELIRTHDTKEIIQTQLLKYLLFMSTGSFKTNRKLKLLAAVLEYLKRLHQFSHSLRLVCRGLNSLY